ncbi:MAG: hypothetical protein ACQEXX_31620 [Bacillota bacterium]
MIKIKKAVYSIVIASSIFVAPIVGGAAPVDAYSIENTVGSVTASTTYDISFSSLFINEKIASEASFTKHDLTTLNSKTHL